MIIYISGAISNDFNYKEKFNQAEEKLLKMGHAVLNPTVVPPMFSHGQHLHIDFAMIDISDGLYMLKDWRDSEGAKMEYDYAIKNDKKIFYEKDDFELPTLKEQVRQIKRENEKNCDNCKHLDDYFDCSQCSDHDEWEGKDTKMKIILLSGKAFSGKDSAANMMKAKLEAKGKKVLIAHYGDLVKYTCKTFFDWNGEKDEQGRTLLQVIGTDRIRAKYPNFWAGYVKSILEVFYDEWNYVLIPDTRFPNEIDLMKNTFDDVVSVCVVRTNFISPLTEEQQNHKSETALDDRIFDYYLVADDLEKLERKVDVFLKELEG